jgi:hypothetical protein
MLGLSWNGSQLTRVAISPSSSASAFSRRRLPI